MNTNSKTSGIRFDLSVLHFQYPAQLGRLWALKKYILDECLPLLSQKYLSDKNVVMKIFSHRSIKMIF